MKIFLIGGITAEESDPSYSEQVSALSESMSQLGKGIACAGHELLVCSPFEGSADVAAAVSALNSGTTSTVEFHYPDTPQVTAEMEVLRKRYPLCNHLKSFKYPASADERGTVVLEYAWLLSQTYAMDRSHGVIALGGKLGRSASLLLGLVDVRKKPLLPLTFLGGAAAQAFEKRRYLLEDRLGSDLDALHDSTRTAEAVSLLVRTTGDGASAIPTPDPVRFFVSYPRDRPQEADFVETALRRRQFAVFRDERSFAPGTPIEGAIEGAIYNSTVFIAIWCKEYACSDWCFDELNIALQRRDVGKLKIWILCVDGTRIVPPGARKLINYSSRSREELERHLMFLLEQNGNLVSN